MRHATQLAWLHAVSKEDAARSDALARFMLKAGFVPGEDLRAAIFGRGRDAPRDFSYRHEPFLDAYGDCELEPPSTPRAYPYRSKACLADVRPYLLAARHDTLLPAIEALQALNRGESPDSAYRDQSALLPMATTSASRTADALERRFDRLGFGGSRAAPRSAATGSGPAPCGRSPSGCWRRSSATAAARSAAAPTPTPWPTSPSASRSATTASSGPPTGSPTARRSGAGSCPTGTATAAT